MLNSLFKGTVFVSLCCIVGLTMTGCPYERAVLVPQQAESPEKTQTRELCSTACACLEIMDRVESEPINTGKRCELLSECGDGEYCSSAGWCNIPCNTFCQRSVERGLWNLKACTPDENACDVFVTCLTSGLDDRSVSTHDAGVCSESSCPLPPPRR